MCHLNDFRDIPMFYLQSVFQVDLIVATVFAEVMISFISIKVSKSAKERKKKTRPAEVNYMMTSLKRCQFIIMRASHIIISRIARTV